MADGTIELHEICSRLGFSEIPEILEAASTPVRRGHHLALMAGAGSGKSAVVGLAVLEACDVDEDSLQALVLVPEADHAWRMAAAVQRVVGPEGFVVACPSASPDDERATEPDEGRATAHVLVGRPSKLLPEIRAGRHSISGLRLLVIDGVAALRSLDEWSSVEPILETLPKENRKIAISDRIDEAFARLIERQLPRARRWPEELMPLKQAEAGDEDGAAFSPVGAALVRPAYFVQACEQCVRDADGLGCERVDFACTTPEAATRLASELAVAGVAASREDDGRVASVSLPGEGPVAVVQVGLPFRLEALASAFEGDGPRYAVIEPRHAPQMDLHLRRLHRQLAPLKGQLLREELDPVRRYRLRIREALDSSDLMSELLILEPLIEELGAARVAGVLSALLRHRGDEQGPVRPWADVEAASTAPGWKAPSGTPARQLDSVPKGARPAWTRLFFGVGRRDEAKPGDLVGAITGETGIAGAQIGKIEIMGNFSLVDVDSQVADEVLRKLDGVTIRGREVPVKRDRET